MSNNADLCIITSSSYPNWAPGLGINYWHMVSEPDEKTKLQEEFKIAADNLRAFWFEIFVYKAAARQVPIVTCDFRTPPEFFRQIKENCNRIYQFDPLHMYEQSPAFPTRAGARHIAINEAVALTKASHYLMMEGEKAYFTPEAITIADSLHQRGVHYGVIGRYDLERYPIVQKITEGKLNTISTNRLIDLGYPIASDTGHPADFLSGTRTFNLDMANKMIKNPPPPDSHYMDYYHYLYKFFIEGLQEGMEISKELVITHGHQSYPDKQTDFEGATISSAYYHKRFDQFNAIYRDFNRFLPVSQYTISQELASFAVELREEVEKYAQIDPTKDWRAINPEGRDAVLQLTQPWLQGTHQVEGHSFSNPERRL